jgi:hypothetical protein
MPQKTTFEVHEKTPEMQQYQKLESYWPLLLMR